MDMKRTWSIIIFYIVVIVVLAMAPYIKTANSDIITAVAAATNNASMIGMSVVPSFGAPLIILSIMLSFGLMAFDKTQAAKLSDVMGAVALSVAQIIGLTFYESVIGYVDTLLTGASGFETILYGIIPLALYMGILAASGSWSVGKRIYEKFRKKKSKSGGGAQAVAAY